MFIIVYWSVRHARFQIRQCTWFLRQTRLETLVGGSYGGGFSFESTGLEWLLFAAWRWTNARVSADPWLQVAADMRPKPVMDRRPKSAAFSLSLSLKGKDKTCWVVSVCGFWGSQQEVCTKEYRKRHSVGALYFPIVARKAKCMLRRGIRESITVGCTSSHWPWYPQ